MKKILAVMFMLLLASEALALPVSYDLRDENRVTGVKNQGIPGPCWAFAAVSAMESNYLTRKLNANGKEPDLSEMQIAYYMYKDPKPERNFTSVKGSGTLDREGNTFMPVAFLSRLSGPTDERFLPYNTNINSSERASLAKKSPESFKRSMRLREAFFLSGTSALNEDSRKELIMKHGAIVVNMYSDLTKYHIDGNYYTYYNPSHGTKTNHLVTLIGWDDNFSRDYFRPKPNRNGAWLVKNSWGTLRGNNGGYVWLSYDQHTWGGTAFIVENNISRLKHYGYDDLGWCTTVRYQWGANVFRVNSRREKLRDAAFYTTGNNTSYELYVYDLGENFTGSPVSGRLLAKREGSIKYAGYHTINMPKDITLKDGQYFSVVLKLSNGVMPVESPIKDYSDNAVVNERESYFSKDGKSWTDGAKINSNVCIKAFTITR